MSEPGYPWSRGDTLYADKLNEAFTLAVKKAGDTMTGPLVLSGLPTDPSHAASKQYVDALVAASMGGGGGGGASITVSDTAPAVPALNSLWFDSVGCQLYLYYNDGNSSQWVNTTNAGIGPSIVASDTAPASPAANMLWWDSVGLQLYVYYNDGTSSQWVPASNQNATIGEAATDGRLYGRRNASWSPLDAQPEINRNQGRNYLDNPGFRVNQRGFVSVNTSVYCYDRWLVQLSADTSSLSAANASDAQRTQIGIEDIQSFPNVGVVSAGGAASYTVLCQRMLGVQRLANKTVTVSFYANADLNTRKLGVSLDQNFGTGGSPSAGVQGNGNAITIAGGTTWGRYSTTLTLPSTIGKTFGSNGDGFTQLNLWYSAGSTNAARAGSIGVQNGAIINVWGVQVEEGSYPTPYSQLEVWEDVDRCQAYFMSGNFTDYGYNVAGAAIIRTVSLSRSMRAVPSVFNFNFTTNVNVTTPQLVSQGNYAYAFQGSATGSGPYGVQAAWNATADL